MRRYVIVTAAQARELSSTLLKLEGYPRRDVSRGGGRHSHSTAERPCFWSTSRAGRNVAVPVPNEDVGEENDVLTSDEAEQVNALRRGQLIDQVPETWFNEDEYGVRRTERFDPYTGPSRDPQGDLVDK